MAGRASGGPMCGPPPRGGHDSVIPSDDYWHFRRCERVLHRERRPSGEAMPVDPPLGLTRALRGGDPHLCPLPRSETTQGDSDGRAGQTAESQAQAYHRPEVHLHERRGRGGGTQQDEAANSPGGRGGQAPGGVSGG